MKNFKGKVAVVTGAATGIGKSLAIQLSNLGCDIAICDIVTDKMEETVSLLNKSVKVFYKTVNCRNREEVFTFADDVINKFGKVDLVFNNAGAVLCAQMSNITVEEMDWQMKSCFYSVVNGTQAFLPHLEKRPYAVVGNVSSIFGFVPALGVGAYNSAKYAVKGYTEALSIEYRAKEKNVHFLSIHPGGIKTEFVNNARFSSHPNKDINKELLRGIYNDVIFITTADKAASTIIKAVKRRKRRVMLGKDAKFLNVFSRFFPNAVEAFMLSFENTAMKKYLKLQKKKERKMRKN